MNKWILSFLAAAQFGAVSAQAQAVNVLSPVEVSEGFGLLFDGTLQSFKDNFVDYVKDTPGSTSLSALWKVDAANSSIGTTERTGDARTKKLYKDFDLRLDYRCDANQGIFYRLLLRGDRAWHTGVEFAINNYTTDSKDAPGAAYDLWGPKPNTYKLYNTNAWNTVRIVAIKDSVEHWVNGTKVVAFKLHSPAFWAAYNVSKWNSGNNMTLKVQGNRNGGYIDEGYLGFQADHGGKWSIRNLRVKTENLYHGPVKTDVVSLQREELNTPLQYTELKRTPAGLSLAFNGRTVNTAEIVGLDGKVMSVGSLANGGRSAFFAGSLKPGIYVLRMATVHGPASQKLNLF